MKSNTARGLAALTLLCLCLPHASAFTITPATPGISVPSAVAIDAAFMYSQTGIQLQTAFVAFADGTSVQFGTGVGADLKLDSINPEGATFITDDGFPTTANPFWISIESDGSQGANLPYAYLFNLGRSGVGGINSITISPNDPLVVSGFWPADGSVSRITFYDGVPRVSEAGSTAALLGLSLLGLAAIRRKLCGA